MWFTETPWPPFFICSVIAAACFAHWHVHRHPRQLYLAGAFLALGGAVILVERLIVTEKERVANQVFALARAFEAGDAPGCVDFFSLQDAEDRAVVQNAVSAARIVGSIRITDMSVQMSSAESRATTTFRASATVNYLGREQHGATRWELTWQREGADWKIIRIRRLHFVGEGGIPPFSPQE